MGAGLLGLLIGLLQGGLPGGFDGLLLLIFLFKADALNMDVHLDHVQAGHALDGLADVFLHLGGHLVDGRAVFDGDIQVHRRFLAAQLHLDAAGNVAVAADNIPKAAAGHHPRDPIDLGRGHAGDDGDNFIGVFYRSPVLQIQIHIDGQIFFLGRHRYAPPL